jgi:anti-sigma regulatory factor (Ser/Thr protein kinase)
MVRGRLEAWGLEAELATVELAVSELVTNAIVHGRGLIDVSLTRVDGRLRLDVSDEGAHDATGLPAARGDRDDLGGWGLQLVDRLAVDWGVGQWGGRTHVWMERPAPDR